LQVDLDDILDPGFLVPVAGGVVVLIGVLVGIFKLATANKAKDMIPRWARGAYSIWTGGEDSGTWARDRAANALRNWYGATHVGQFREVIADLKQGTTGNPAWDLVRALDLLRIGHAAGYIDADECWTESGRICRTLQSTNGGWEQLAQSFEAGMRAWQSGRGVTDPQETGRVQRNLPRLRAEIWPAAPWQAKLAVDD
jgi:hypothetical protein